MVCITVLSDFTAISKASSKNLLYSFFFFFFLNEKIAESWPNSHAFAQHGLCITFIQFDLQTLVRVIKRIVLVDIHSAFFWKGHPVEFLSIAKGFNAVERNTSYKHVWRLLKIISFCNYRLKPFKRELQRVELV